MGFTVQDPRDEAELVRAVKPVLMSKQYGHEDIRAPLVAHACLTVMPDGASGKRPSVNTDSVRVVKLMGGNVHQSSVVHGLLLPRAPESTIKSVTNAKITVFGCGLEAESTETSGTVLIRNADDLLNYNNTEERSLEEIIQGIANTGTNVVISGGSISEMALHFIEKYKMMCVKVQSKWDLRRLCATVGATSLVRIGPATPEEMGACAKVYVKEFGDRKVTVFQQDGMEETQVSTIVLRSSVVSVINDLELARWSSQPSLRPSPITKIASTSMRSESLARPLAKMRRISCRSSTLPTRMENRRRALTSRVVL